jgi:hypothetical protein
MAKVKNKSKAVTNQKAILGLFNNVSILINQSRRRIAYHIHSEMVTVNWHIGKLINENVLQYKRAEYGKAVIAKS